MPPKKRGLLSRIGPGFITGASDDDPSGIATYAQTGALFGYLQLWLVVFTLPLMVAVQEMCGRIGLVTGKGLSGVIRRHYPRWILVPTVLLLLIANTINIGADLGAMAASLKLLLPEISFLTLLIGMTAITVVLEVFLPYRTYVFYLKFLALTLLTYLAAAFVVRQEWGAVLLHAFTPTFSLDPAYLMNVVAFLGTTISPYLFFWQAGEEVEEEVRTHKLRFMGFGRPKVTDRDVASMETDTITGMFFSNLVTFFIILTSASTLHLVGITEIASAADAAKALEPLAGPFSSILFAIGIVGTGLLAVPVLAGSASYAVSEAFGWREGLSEKPLRAKGFYGVIALSTVVGLLINFTPIPPFTMLYYTAVLNGLIAPPLLLLILLISNNPAIMGKRVNPPISNIIGGAVVVVMTVAGVALIWSML